MTTTGPGLTPTGPEREPVRVTEVEPLDVSGLRTVTVGTVLFVLAGLALLPFRDWLQDTGREWWLWTCVAGFGLGMFGIDYCRRRARHRVEPGGGRAAGTRPPG